MRKARIEHRCGDCLRSIEPGETYEYFTALYDGYWFEAKTCVHCIEARRWLLDVCGGWLYTEVLDELREHYIESSLYASVSLGRLLAAGKRQWKNRSVEWVKEKVDDALLRYHALELETMLKVCLRYGWSVLHDPGPDRMFRVIHPEWGEFEARGVVSYERLLSKFRWNETSVKNERAFAKMRERQETDSSV